MAAPLTRRRMLGSMAATAGALALPGTVRKALADTPPQGGSLNDVEHVIMFMQENRSFDHYFGRLSGVRGFEDPFARSNSGRSVFAQQDPKNPDGYTLPFHLDTFTTSAASGPGLSNAWARTHDCWNGGAMDRWVVGQRVAAGQLAMGYFERSDIPFYYALADAFTVCDTYFCSLMGPTQPNRVYQLAGTIGPDGLNGGPDVRGVPDGSLSFPTYPEMLEKAGISWRLYGTNNGMVLRLFKNFAASAPGSSLYDNGLQHRTLDDFLADVANDNLPQVTWLNADFNQSEHAPYLPAVGEMDVYQVLQALAAKPDLWAKTVVFLTYDEHGGYFDHVTPPTPPPGTPGEYITASPLTPDAQGVAGPIGLGPRVPMVVISPWSQGGWVSSEVFDHTSMLRFLEARFGVPVPNLSAWRREICGDL
ncbi:MAG: alkaline phosphatase family protein, partial [Actinoallomurus sp.]